MSADTRIAVVVPTVGRDPDLGHCLESLASQVQEGDRVMVVCDGPDRYDYVQNLVEWARFHTSGAVWRCYPTPGRLGCYGHPARNQAINLLALLKHAPRWVCSIDDDDVYLPGALDAMREAITSQAAPWYVFEMIGGSGSHFAGKTVPVRGSVVEPGNVGTPMLLFPAGARARFGMTGHDDWIPRTPAGYFGDFDMAEALLAELGAPAWVPVCVAEIRPTRVAA